MIKGTTQRDFPPSVFFSLFESYINDHFGFPDNRYRYLLQLQVEESPDYPAEDDRRGLVPLGGGRTRIVFLRPEVTRGSRSTVGRPNCWTSQKLHAFRNSVADPDPPDPHQFP